MERGGKGVLNYPIVFYLHSFLVCPFSIYNGALLMYVALGDVVLGYLGSPKAYVIYGTAELIHLFFTAVSFYFQPNLSSLTGE